MTEPAQPQTPRKVAENEAARQAVTLVFTVVTIGILIVMQRKGGLGDMMQAQHDRVDPSGAARRRMAAAQRAAARWDRAADYLFRVDLVTLARQANQRAEAAREAFERERYV